MAIKYVNNWDSSLLTPVLVTDTVFAIPIADALLLPTLTVGDYILLTLPVIGLTHATSSWEIVKVTAVDTVTGYLTVERAQEGTTAINYSAGQNISMRLTAAAVNDINTSLASQLSQIIKKIETVGAGTGILVDNTDPLNPVLSTIPVSAAGLLNRIIATGDATTLSAGTFYLVKAGDKGTTALVSQTVAVDDNQKLYFAQDFVTDAMPSDTVYYGGTYSGSVSVSTSDISELIKYTVEVYLTDTNGTPIDSGLASEVIGDLGVKPLTVLSSGNINLSTTGTTNLQVSGSLSQNFTVTTGQRVRFHVSAEKVGINGGIFTLALYTGYNVNFYVDVPVAIKTSSVINDSSVIGSTLLDVINSLKTSIDQYTAADVLAKLLTVDGHGSGLDADTLDGVQLTDVVTKISVLPVSTDLNTIINSGFYRIEDTPVNGPTQFPAGFSQLVVASGGGDTIFQMIIKYDTGVVVTRSAYGLGTTTIVWSPWSRLWSETNQGAGSGLDADMLDGQHGSFYTDFATSEAIMYAIALG